MAQYDARNTGTHPNATGPMGSLSADWEFGVEYRNAFRVSRPAVVDGTVYAGVVIFGSLPAALLAIDAEDGSEQWRYETEGDVLVTPAVDEERVYVVADGGLRAIDRASGDGEWTYQLPAGGGDPTVVDDTVYVVGGEPAVHAVDTDTGEARWTTSGETAPMGRTPAVVDGRVLVTVADEGAVLALDDGAEGAELWRAPVDQPTDAPVATGEAIVVGDADGGLHRIGSDGDVEWSESALEVGPRSSSVGVVAPALADDVLYYCGQDGELAAVGVDGERRWREHLSCQPAAGPVVADGVVYVAGAASEGTDDAASGSGVVYGVSADGEIVLEHRDAAGYWAPAVLDDTAYLGVLRTEGQSTLHVTALN